MVVYDEDTKKQYLRKKINDLENKIYKKAQFGLPYRDLEKKRLETKKILEKLNEGFNEGIPYEEALSGV